MDNNELDNNYEYNNEEKKRLGRKVVDVFKAAGTYIADDIKKDYDEERYEDLMYNHKLLQMKRRQLITHINYLNKEFYEVLI